MNKQDFISIEPNEYVRHSLSNPWFDWRCDQCERMFPEHILPTLTDDYAELCPECFEKEEK